MKLGRLAAVAVLVLRVGAGIAPIPKKDLLLEKKKELAVVAGPIENPERTKYFHEPGYVTTAFRAWMWMRMGA
jgi:hypothetical protein